MTNSMLGKWDSWYKNITKMTSFRYGNTLTYQLAEEFLHDLEVEDWGCGTGGFRRLHRGKYHGLDGSYNPFVDKVVDLCNYKSNVEGIMMRHVLEHNYDWEKVLKNAVASFTNRFCLVLFTPFSEKTREIAHNKKYGVDVPDISFNKLDLERQFNNLTWELKQDLKTKTGYGIEHVYLIQR